MGGQSCALLTPVCPIAGPGCERPPISTARDPLLSPSCSPSSSVFLQTRLTEQFVILLGSRAVLQQGRQTGTELFACEISARDLGIPSQHQQCVGQLLPKASLCQSTAMRKALSPGSVSAPRLLYLPPGHCICPQVIISAPRSLSLPWSSMAMQAVTADCAAED